MIGVKVDMSREDASIFKPRSGFDVSFDVVVFYGCNDIGCRSSNVIRLDSEHLENGLAGLFGCRPFESWIKSLVA